MNQVIPEAAVEAAARAMHADAYPPDYWDSRPDLRHIFTKRAELALEAAAPHMLNPAPPIPEGPSEGADAVTGFPRAAYRKRKMG